MIRIRCGCASTASSLASSFVTNVRDGIGLASLYAPSIKGRHQQFNMFKYNNIKEYLSGLAQLITVHPPNEIFLSQCKHWTEMVGEFSERI